MDPHNKLDSLIEVIVAENITNCVNVWTNTNSKNNIFELFFSQFSIVATNHSKDDFSDVRSIIGNFETS